MKKKEKIYKIIYMVNIKGKKKKKKKKKKKQAAKMSLKVKTHKKK